MKKNHFLFFLFLLFCFSSFSQNLIYEDSIKQNQQLQKLYDGSIEANIDSKNLLSEEIKNLSFIDNSNVSISNFIFNLLLTALFSFFIAYTYTNYGNSISNRKQFSKNFLMLSLTTMLVITVVKSSLALSLGLVGALSIIRFRSAIKEPEELTYLFLAISLGLGFGANQTVITIVAISLIIFFIIFSKKYNSNYHDNQNLFISLVSSNPSLISSKNILDTAIKYCKNVNLRRIDEDSDVIEVSISVELTDYSDIIKLKEELRSFDNDIKFTFLDNKGILG